MREKAIERRNINKEHNSNFKAGYVPIEEERLHKTGLRGRKGNMAVCIIVLLFLLALINLIVSTASQNALICPNTQLKQLKMPLQSWWMKLIYCVINEEFYCPEKNSNRFTISQITLVIWTVIRIGPNGCDSMEFHETGLLRFKQKADMGIVHPLHKSTVGGRKDQDLVITGNNNPVRNNTKHLPSKLKTCKPELKHW